MAAWEHELFVDASLSLSFKKLLDTSLLGKKQTFSANKWILPPSSKKNLIQNL